MNMPYAVNYSAWRSDALASKNYGLILKAEETLFVTSDTLKVKLLCCKVT